MRRHYELPSQVDELIRNGSKVAIEKKNGKDLLSIPTGQISFW